MNSFTDPTNVAGTSTTDISVFGQIVRNGGVTITGDPAGGIYVATVPFIWGQPLYFNVSLTAFAANSLTSPLSLGNGDAATDAGHSLYWGGLSGATANGAPVSSFTLTSASGTDYSQSFAPTSAPEPAVGLLTGALLAGLALARRFR